MVPWRLFVCIFLVSQEMSRSKHPFQALSSVGIHTLTREALSAFLSKKELANQIAKLLSIVIKKIFLLLSQ